MYERLVSIISACYNKEFALERFMQSVIDQDYRPIELIMVDDGSSDGSWDLLNKYIDTLQSHNITFKLSRQENQGVGYAINNCLRQVEGAFLCWPDCDDWLDTHSIRKRVEFFTNNPEYNIVTSDALIYSEGDLDNPIGLISGKKPERFEKNQFELLLEGNSIVCSGCHMVRTDALFEVLAGNQIFPSRFGQNLQLLFPMLYHYDRGFIDEPLYYCVIYGSSLSHYQKSFEKSWAHREGRYQIKRETIMRIAGMPEEERKKYLSTISIQEARYRLQIAEEFSKKDVASKQLIWLKELKALSFPDVLQWMRIIVKCIIHK